MLKKRMLIEQFLPAFHYGDAIGNSTLTFDTFLKSRGIPSRIIALSVDQELKQRAITFEDYLKENSNQQTLKILHFAIPSPLSDYFKSCSGKKVLIYHNITPHEFFIDFSSELVRFISRGRMELKELVNTFDLSIADSEYNAAELRELGFNNVLSFPIMVNLQDYSQPFARRYAQLFQDGRKNLLFVGRISSNKKIEDLVKVLFFYKKFLSPAVRLIVAGNCNTLPAYYYAVYDLACRFCLTAEDIFFTGHIPFEELLALYNIADAFVTLSEHEGFCLPLIESAFFNLATFAYDAGAVAETLAGGGVLIKEKKIDTLATLLYQVLSSESELTKVKNSCKKTLLTYQEKSKPEKLLALLQQL